MRAPLKVTATLAMLMASGMGLAQAQTDHQQHHPGGMPPPQTQAQPPAMMAQSQGQMPMMQGMGGMMDSGSGMAGSSGMMNCPMMMGGMGGGRMGARGMGPGMMGGSGHMTKVMFAIADANGDGALSFEEVTAIHKRVFDRVDGNKNAKVSLDEVQTFMRE
jgi:EF hand